MLTILRRAQSTAEYAILVALVVAAAMGVQNYVKKSLQAAVKERADLFVKEVAGDAKTQWEAVEATKTTTGQVSTKTFREDYENEKTPFVYRETTSADYSSSTVQ